MPLIYIKKPRKEINYIIKFHYICLLKYRYLNTIYRKQLYYSICHLYAKKYCKL